MPFAVGFLAIAKVSWLFSLDSRDFDDTMGVGDGIFIALVEQP